MKTAPIFSRPASFSALPSPAPLCCRRAARPRRLQPHFMPSSSTTTLRPTAPVFSVQDSVNFYQPQVNEVFSDGFTQSLSFRDLYGDPAGTVTAQDVVPSSAAILLCRQAADIPIRLTAR